MKNAPGPRIVVLGGGFGGLEASRYARMLLPKTDITLVSDKDYFLFKPNNIYVPFGLDPARSMVRLAAPTRRDNIRLVHARAHGVDPLSKRISVQAQDQSFDIEYDFLVVATGAGMMPGEIPGLRSSSTASWSPEAMLNLRTELHRLVEEARAGERCKVLFAALPNDYSGPLYEMVMILDTWLRRKHIREQIEIAFSTYEGHYLQAFGHGLHEIVMSEFRVRGIEGYTGLSLDYMEPGSSGAPGHAVYRNNQRLPYDLLIAFPPYAASTFYGSFPANERGFISTELATGQVVEHPDVYAIGDATDFPVKQALLAFLQADTAAEHISARILGTNPGSRPNLTAGNFMDDSDNVALGQISARAWGLSANLTQRDPDLDYWTGHDSHDRHYGHSKVASAPLWGLARRMVGAYLPWRFKAGNPFHTNAPWKGMEFKLSLMPVSSGALFQESIAACAFALDRSP